MRPGAKGLAGCLRQPLQYWMRSALATPACACLCEVQCREALTLRCGLLPTIRNSNRETAQGLTSLSVAFGACRKAGMRGSGSKWPLRPEQPHRLPGPLEAKNAEEALEVVREHAEVHLRLNVLHAIELRLRTSDPTALFVLALPGGFRLTPDIDQCAQHKGFVGAEVADVFGGWSCPFSGWPRLKHHRHER